MFIRTHLKYNIDNLYVTAYNKSMKQILYYTSADNKCPYLDWFNELDVSMQVRVNKRVKKLSEGVYGDHKPLQKSELSELRMDFGKGYRIYYYDLDEAVVFQNTYKQAARIKCATLGWNGLKELMNGDEKDGKKD